MLKWLLALVLVLLVSWSTAAEVKDTRSQPSIAQMTMSQLYMKDQLHATQRVAQHYKKKAEELEARRKTNN